MSLKIFRMDSNGIITLPALWDADWTYVATIIDISMQFLSTRDVKYALVDIALRIDRHEPDPWYGKLNGNVDRAKQAVRVFLDKLHSNFPMVVIDDRIDDRRCLGYHPRGTWNGVFEPGRQAVHLNASVSLSPPPPCSIFPWLLQALNFVANCEQRVRDMCAAASHGGPSFHRFLFMFVHTFLHEVGGHLFVTYLTRGEPTNPRAYGATPPDVTTPLDSYSTGETGEAGRALEYTLFGGNIDYYRDPAKGDRQVSPYLPSKHRLLTRIYSLVYRMLTR